MSKSEKTNDVPSQLAESSTGVRVEGDATPRRKYRLYGNPNLGPIPFRLPDGSPVPMIKDDDPPSLRPQQTMDAHSAVFRFAHEKELKAYNRIIDLTAKRRAQISREEIHWSDVDQNFVVFLRWVELFLELPSPPSLRPE